MCGNYWLPEARSTLADVLGQSNYQATNSTHKAQTCLLALTQDGQFRVRRSAYHALAKISPETFQTLVASLAYAESADLRERAAEAISWSDSNEPTENLYVDLSKRLQSDPEPTVRKIAEHSYSERWRRSCANNCLSLL